MQVMNYDEFKRQLGKAGLTITEFSALVKANRVSFSNRKKTGDVPSHWAVVAALLAEMAENHIDFRGPLSKIEIEPKKPRGPGKLGKFGGDKQEEMFAEKGSSNAQH